MKFSVYIIWTSVMRPSKNIHWKKATNLSIAIKRFWSTGYRFYLLIIVRITYKDKANH
jgi:hypothetical protein